MFKIPRLILLLFLIFNATLYAISHYPVDSLTFHQMLRIGRGNIHGLAWSVDGETLAVDTITGTWLYTAELEDKAHLPEFRHAAFSPDGRWLAGASAGNEVGVMDATRFEAVTVLHGHDAEVLHVAWSSANTLASIDVDGALIVWDMEREQPFYRDQGVQEVSQLLWNPDGTYLGAIGSDGTLIVWDIDRIHGQQLAKIPFEGDRNARFDIAWTNDVSLVRSWRRSRDVYSTEHLDIETGVRLASPTIPQRGLHWHSYPGLVSRDGLFIVYEWPLQNPSTLRFISQSTGENLLMPARHDGGIADVTWAADSRHIASASGYGQLFSWSISQEHPRLVSMNTAHTAMTHVAWRTDGRMIATVSISTTVSLWESSTGKHQVTIQGGSYHWYAAPLVWQPGGTLLAIRGHSHDTRNQISVWETNPISATPVYSFTLSQKVLDMSWSPDGKQLAIYTQENYLHVWHSVGRWTVLQLDLGRQWQYYAYDPPLHWSPDSKLLFVKRSGRIIDVNAGEEIPANVHTSAADERWTPDNDLVHVIGGSTSYLHSPHGPCSYQFVRLQTAYSLAANMTGQPPPVNIDFPPMPAAIWKAKFSPDGTRIAVTDCDGNLGVWGVNGRAILPIQSESQDVEWSPDGHVLSVIGYRQPRRLIDAWTGETLVTFDTNAEVGFSMDGRRVAVIEDGTIAIWDAELHCNSTRIIGIRRWCD